VEAVILFLLSAGLAILIFVLDKTVKTMPLGGIIAGYSVAALCFICAVALAICRWRTHHTESASTLVHTADKPQSDTPPRTSPPNTDVTTLLVKARAGAESLQKIKSTVDISDELSDAWQEMVEIGHQFKDATAGLNGLLPNPNSEADAKIRELQRFLERGVAIIQRHKRRHNLVAFQSEINQNCEDIKTHIEGIWKYII